MCYLTIRRVDATHLDAVAATGDLDALQLCVMRGDCASIREDGTMNMDNEDTWKKNYIIQLPGVPASRMAYLLEEEWSVPDNVVKERIIDGRRITYREKPRQIKFRKYQFDVSELRKRLSTLESNTLDVEDNYPAKTTEDDVKFEGVIRDRYRTAEMMAERVAAYEAEQERLAAEATG